MWPEVTTHLQKLKDGKQVLDLGCGNGRLLTGIKAKVNYTGIDFSKKLINIAREKYPQYKFILKDLTKPKTWESLPKFDAIFCIAVLHHIPNKNQQLFILKEIKKHLKKDGLLFLSVWNLWQPKYLKHHLTLESLKLKLKNPKYLYVPFQKSNRFCVAFDKNYLNKLLVSSGFIDIQAYYSDKKGTKTNFLKGQNLCAVSVLLTN